jgi:hypothetical protein
MVTVACKLTPAQLAKLDQLAAERKTSRSGALRWLVEYRGAPEVPRALDAPLATRAELLALLSEAARGGRVDAQRALLAELRDEDQADAELSRLLGE